MRTLLLLAVAIAALGSMAPATAELPSCPYEDGNPLGLPCEWTDPDTGTRYYTPSDNYRG